MESNVVFHYQYSASANTEVQAIRKKYLPQPESKLDELKQLDNQVQSAGNIESLCVGIPSALVFGTGMCLAMQVIATGAIAIAGGVVLGLAGAAGMLAAYPVYRKKYQAAKAELSPRILELANELGCN